MSPERPFLAGSPPHRKPANAQPVPVSAARWLVTRMLAMRPFRHFGSIGSGSVHPNCSGAGRPAAVLKIGLFILHCVA